MLLDLGRNDVGRVAEVGTVAVTDQFVIERYSHVMHIVSNVVGKLAKGHDSVDALMAGFPAGTVSGAPKVRAMEVIDELEKSKRGPYAGCVGYFTADGEMDTCIVLRTAIVKDGKLHVQAGAGVVYRLASPRTSSRNASTKPKPSCARPKRRCGLHREGSEGRRLAGMAACLGDVSSSGPGPRIHRAAHFIFLTSTLIAGNGHPKPEDDIAHMLTLSLLRHAKSAWGDLELDDYERGLAPRGIKAAPQIGRHLRKEKLKPDLVLCSGAVRTRATLALILPETRRPASRDPLRRRVVSRLADHHAGRRAPPRAGSETRHDDRPQSRPARAGAGTDRKGRAKSSRRAGHQVPDHGAGRPDLPGHNLAGRPPWNWATGSVRDAERLEGLGCRLQVTGDRLRVTWIRSFRHLPSDPL